MKEINFVDQTFRDAQQSLWGNMMRTEHMIPVAEMMDKIGFSAISTVGSQGFTVQIRNLGEDPWERIRKLSGLIKQTPLRGSYGIGSLSSFDLSTPRDIINLWIKRSVANGIKSFWVCDYQYEMEKFIYFARIAKAEGAEVVPSLMYTSSPFHDDEYWEHKTRLLLEARDCIDRIMIEDASGVITPEETRAFITTVLKHCEGLPLEFHSHCNSGLAPLSYLEAIKSGVTTVHTAMAPLANGTSQPSTESILKNVQRLGYTTNLDEDILNEVSAYFRDLADREGLPTGVPMEYDLFHFEHQIPGGMMTNLTRQLREVGMEDRLDEIIEEVVQVRKEFGYPVMATPYSQIVGAQGVENVISGKRYEKITDEAIKYVLGYYGEPVIPVDEKVRDRVMELPRTRKFEDWKPEGYLKSVEEFREETGPELSDDDLLLEVIIPGGFVKRKGPRPAPLVRPAGGGKPIQQTDVPMEYSIDVDGETFNVRISPVHNREEGQSGEVSNEKISRGPKEIPPGAVIPNMAGMLVSLAVEVGQIVEEGDLLGTIEAMKMMRDVEAPHGGVVKEIYYQGGEMIEIDDVLMVVGAENE